MKHWTTSSGYTIFRVLRFRSNAFLVTNGRNNLLVDSGTKRYRRQLLWSLAKLGVSHLDALILTHSHFDHAGNAHYIQNRFHTPVLIHSDEAGYLQNGQTPVPGGTMLLTRFLIRNFGNKVGSLMKFEPCEANQTFKTRLDLSKFGFKGYILPTPGHSQGSVSIVIDDDIVLAGDALFGVFPASVMPPYAQDKGLMIQSWKILLDTGAGSFFTAHGKPLTIKAIESCYNKNIRNITLNSQS